MTLQYSCFISYRHGTSPLAERIVEDLSSALQGELELYTSKRLFVDKSRLKGGDMFVDQLALALCQSACMLMIFTPTYFDAQSPFCAREFLGMEAIERKRLGEIQRLLNRKAGLIIPVVFRGERSLPSEIRDRRNFHNFDSFLLSDIEMGRHPGYSARIKQIAEEIFEICEAMDRLDCDPCDGCENFTLPNERDVINWLRGLKATRISFPNRPGV
jgi:hypothetical protein